MKKHVHGLFLIAVLLASGQLTFAANEDAFSSCCKPPSNLELDCEELPSYFNPYDIHQLQQLFGKAKNWCNPGLVGELDPIVNLTSCETGTIIRRFRASNNYGSYDYCEQKITITGSHEYKIRFPADLQLSCGERPGNFNVIVDQSSCDYLVVNVKDHEFFDGNKNCGKILRTYKVINWCEYDTESQPTVIGRDEDCDGDPGDEDVWVIRRRSGYAFIDRNGNENDDNPRAGERRTCTPSNPKGYWRSTISKGYWQYTQHIKIGDNDAPVISAQTPEPFCSYNNLTCKGFVQIPFAVDDECTPNDVLIKVFVDGQQIASYARAGSYTASGQYSLGAHILEIHAKDGCGNPTVRKIPFEVIDCAAPTPTCINGLTVTLMPLPNDIDVTGDGEPDAAAATIWAKDLLVSQINDCSGVAGFSINRVGETPDFNQKSLTVTCDDPSTLDIEVYAWDDAFNPTAVQPDGTTGGRNYTFCRTYLLIQDNNDLCGSEVGTGFIAGSVYTEGGHGLPDVSMMLISQDSNLLDTDADGLFIFDSIPMQQSYKVVPTMNTNPAEGISIVDLILLQQHLMGIEPIRSPYRLIAADINRNGSVDEADAAALRNVMLGLVPEFPNNHSWRFINAAYVFPNPLNPWQEEFPEYMEIGSLSAAENYGNFIAIKIGDINGSIIADRRNASARFYTNLPLQLLARDIRAGETISVPVVADMQHVSGVQFALQFKPDQVTLLDIEPGLIDEKSVYLQREGGLVTVVWNNLDAAGSTDAVLFTLRLQGQQSAQLEETVRLSSRHLQPIALQGDAIARLNLSFAAEPATAKAFALLQNSPNPFHSETRISFELPAAGNALIRITDLSGRELWRREGNFDSGFNQVIIHKNELAASGVLLYSVETDAYRATKKMVVLP